MYDQLLGLVQSNAGVYFYSLSNGYSHEESLERVVKTRYFFFRGNRKRVNALYVEFKDNEPANVDCTNETKELAFLIQAIAFNELKFKHSLRRILMDINYTNIQSEYT